MAASPEEELSTSTKLALERTRLAHERALMAWVRTATSLISFGFTIYKAFEYLRQRQPDVARGVLGPRNFSLVLIGLGIGALVLATVQHRADLHRLEARYGALPRSTAAIVATIVSLLGIVALILVFLRQ